MAKRPMKPKTREVLIYTASGIITAAALVFILFGIKKCKGDESENINAENTALLKAETARADSTENVAKTLILQNDSLRQDLATANDSIIVLNDSIDVLKKKNGVLKHERDSLAAGWDDCKGGKKPVAKKAPVVAAKKSTSAQPVAKPVSVAQMPVVELPKEPVISVDQKPQNTGASDIDVNINSPYNTIQVSNGGVINNYYGEEKKSTESKETIERDLDAYRNTIFISAKKIKCK